MLNKSLKKNKIRKETRGNLRGVIGKSRPQRSANKTKPPSLVIALPHQEKTAPEYNCYLIIIVNKGSTCPIWLALAGVRFNLWLLLAETNIQSERGWHQWLD